MDEPDYSFQMEQVVAVWNQALSIITKVYWGHLVEVRPYREEVISLQFIPYRTRGNVKYLTTVQKNRIASCNSVSKAD